MSSQYVVQVEIADFVYSKRYVVVLFNMNVMIRILKPFYLVSDMPFSLSEGPASNHLHVQFKFDKIIS